MNRTKTAMAFITLYAVIAGYYLSRTNTKTESLIFLFPPLLAALLGFYAANTYKLENIHG